MTVGCCATRQRAVLVFELIRLAMYSTLTSESHRVPTRLRAHVIWSVVPLSQFPSQMEEKKLAVFDSEMHMSGCGTLNCLFNHFFSSRVLLRAVRWS